MKNNKFRRLSAALACLFVLLTFAAIPAQAKDLKYGTQDISAELELGYNGTGPIFSGNGYNPYFINEGSLKLSNHTGDTVSGYAEITGGYLMDTNDPSSFVAQSDFTFYVPVELTPGITKSVAFRGTWFSSPPQTRIRLYDSRRNLIFEQVGNMPNGLSAPSVIGWMSDNPSEYSVLSRNSGNCIAVPLSGSGFPSDFTVLRQFSAIVVGNTDLSASSSYTPEQIGLLKKYLLEGGTVIVSTGDQAGILENFSEYFLGPVSSGYSVSQGIIKDDITPIAFLYSDILYSGITYPSYTWEDTAYGTGTDVLWYDGSGQIQSGIGYQEEKMPVSFPKAGICAVTDENFIPCRKAGEGTPEFYRHKDVNLYIANFNLGNKTLLGTQDSETILLSLFADAGIHIAKLLNTESEFVDKSLMADLNSRKFPFAVMVILLLVYAFGGVLTPFIVSKAKKKPKIAAIGIPAAAILFSVAVFFVGLTYHGIGNESFSITICELEKDGQATSFRSSVSTSPTGGQKNITFSQPDTVYLKPAYDYSDTTAYDFRKDGGFICSQSAARSNLFCYGYYRTAFDGCFEVSSTRNEDNSVNLTVTNRTGVDLTEAAVQAFGNTLIIGDFKNGESRTFSNLFYQVAGIALLSDIRELFYVPNGIPDYNLKNEMPQIAQSTYRYRYYSNQPPFSSLSEEDPVLARKASAYLVCKLTQRYDLGIHVTGFTDGGASDVRVNGKKTRDEGSVTMLHQALNVSVTPETDVAMPLAELSLSYSSNCGMPNGNTAELYPGGYAVYTASVPSPISLKDRLVFRLDTEADLKDLEVFFCPLDTNRYDAIKAVKAGIVSEKDKTVAVDAGLLAGMMSTQYNDYWKFFLQLPDMEIPIYDVPVVPGTYSLGLVIRRTDFLGEDVLIDSVYCWSEAAKDTTED